MQIASPSKYRWVRNDVDLWDEGAQFLPERNTLSAMGLPMMKNNCHYEDQYRLRLNIS